ncbi:MAG TPA: DUF1259 domain-containing protein [Gemmatimonadaceae bacterium]|jgi:hypothetical protein|nr:DUF1259 domain-containing protein [Gemmatimonadaceae bacterium]
MITMLRRPLLLSAMAVTTAQAQSPWSAVQSILGRPPVMQAGDVARFNFPRSDLTVTAGGVTLKPAFALGGWVAFKQFGGESVAMGDLVLLDGEVPAVMRALQAGGVEQSALHNHLLGESPHLMYMHIMAHGDASTIATTIRGALAKSATPLGTPGPAASPSAADLDTAGIARALGVAGRLNGVVYQVGVPRAEAITEMGHEIPASMGLATSINFQPTGGGRAAITGDFVLRGTEVNAVIRALQSAGIQPAALHSHLIDEEPRIYFMHFWANDDAVKLARGLRAALDATNSKR